LILSPVQSRKFHAMLEKSEWTSSAAYQLTFQWNIEVGNLYCELPTVFELLSYMFM
jgi:hypothetical protein